MTSLSLFNKVVVRWIATLGLIAVSGLGYGYGFSHWPLTPELSATSAILLDESGYTVMSKNPDTSVPIASITKIMTALVLVDEPKNLEGSATILKDDVDRVRFTKKTLKIGGTYSKKLLLDLMLVSSDNMAAHALARTSKQGYSAFISQMNKKAADLGLSGTYFVDPSGLSAFNRGTARDIARLMSIASYVSQIKTAAKTREITVAATLPTKSKNKHTKKLSTTRIFRNTNKLMADTSWQFVVAKTGFHDDAGQCMGLITKINNRSYTFVVLGARGPLSRYKDLAKMQSMLKT